MIRKRIPGMLSLCIALCCVFCTQAVGAIQMRFHADEARFVLRISRGLETADGNAIETYDLNGDGALTEADAFALLRCSVGLEPFALSEAPERALTEENTEQSTQPSTAQDTSARSSSGGSGSDTDDWDKPWGPVPGALPQGETGKYAVNTNTGKFHLPTCKWVGEIHPENRTDSNADRQQIVDAGYTPCKVCTP